MLIGIICYNGGYNNNEVNYFVFVVAGDGGRWYDDLLYFKDSLWMPCEVLAVMLGLCFVLIIWK